MSIKSPLNFKKYHYLSPMKKNVTNKIIEIRKSKGFKTRDMLMHSIEKYCKENKEKLFGDKTLQRMEKNQVASERTLKIVASVLKLNPEDLKLDSSLKSNEKYISDKTYSEIHLGKFKTINNKSFQDNFSKTNKRKFILDIAEISNYGQKRAISKFIELIDKYSKNNLDILTKIKSDDFGSSNLTNSKNDYGDEIDNYIKAFNNGYQFHIDDNENAHPQERWEKITPIYIYYGSHPYATYWPVPEEFYEIKLKESLGGGFSKYFENESFEDKKTGYIYDGTKTRTFVLAPLTLVYSFFVFSTHPNLDKLTYNNEVSKIVMDEWQNISKIDYSSQEEFELDIEINTNKPFFSSLNNKILGKKFTGLFDNIIHDITHGNDFPKNYIDDTDLNIIYGPNTEIKSYDDPDDYISIFRVSVDECIEKIISDAHFYNYIKIIIKDLKINFSLEDNLNSETRKKWLTKNKLINQMENEVKQMIGYYWKGLNEKDRLEAVEKVHKIFLKGGKEFFAELKKTQPITEIS